MRVPNWPVVLAAKVEEWRFQPFAYGSADCWQFAADVVLALTGVDYRECFPPYASCRQALRILSRSRGMRGLAASVLGAPKPVAQALTGDVIIGDFGLGETAGICLGVHCCAPGERGLVFRQTAECTAAWSV
jgi:hypothetical protein